MNLDREVIEEAERSEEAHLGRYERLRSKTWKFNKYRLGLVKDDC